MDYKSLLSQIFKQAHPDMEDTDLDNLVGSMDSQKAPAALAPLMPPTKDQPAFMMPSAAPLDTPSSYDVKDSTSTVKANGGMAPVSLDDSVMQFSGHPYGKEGNEDVQPLPNTLPDASPPMPDTAPTPPASTPDASKGASDGADKVGKSGRDTSFASSNDNAKREAMLARLDKQKKWNILPEALAGAADAVAAGASAFGANASQGHAEKQIERDKGEIDESKKDFETKLKNDPASDVSKQYQGLLARFMQKDASDPMVTSQSAAQIAERIPAIEKLAAIENAKEMKKLQMEALKNQKEMTVGLKHDQQQDKLEQNARMGLMSMRGDQSLQRIEAQRDASITAYNTINTIKKEGRLPSQVEYYDILGQLWKARTGASPSEQAIHDLDAKTFKGSLAKAAQYFSGKPAGVTTTDILNNIQEFAKTSGMQADELHKAYMASRLVKPKDLDEDRWNPLAQAGRGMSFADATKSQAPTDQKSEALAWAKANPSDPRSAKILKKLGM
jgi:hypothetical protein